MDWDREEAGNRVRRSGRRIAVVVLVAVGIVSAFFLISWASGLIWPSPQADGIRISLPEPRYESDVSIEEALLNRRSVRQFSGEPLTLQEVSQLVWAAQGITDPRGLRTAPSAGALYPLELYVVVGNVEDLAEGVYWYRPQEHELEKVLDGDLRADLSEAAMGQASVRGAAVDVVITAVYERTTIQYGDRGIRYVHLEAGHAAQNLCLQATAMDLGIVTAGAFSDDQVKQVLNLPEDEQPLYVIPIGRK